MAILRKRKCLTCEAEYTTSHVTSKFCSDRCRSSDAAKKQAKKRESLASRRIVKLPVNEEWLWVIREVLRAGTCEILHGHTVESLEQLFALRNYRYRCYGWDCENKTSKYHLCHIQAAQGKSSVGLLHPLNLFVGNSLPNQVHGTNSYPDRGLSIPRSSLKRQWLIPEDATDKQIAAKLTKYLGSLLYAYAAANPIRTSQRINLARWIEANDPQKRYKLNELERMGTTELRKIRAQIEEREVYKMNLTAKRSLVVAIEECERLSGLLPDGQHKEDLTFIGPVLRCVAAWLWNEEDEYGFAAVGAPVYGIRFAPLRLREGMDGSKLRDFASFQAFNALQGGEVNQPMVLATLKKYLRVDALEPVYSDVDYFHVQDEVDEFKNQYQLVKDSILRTGLADPEYLHEYLERVKESNSLLEFYESHDWVRCRNLHDYPEAYYEVEDDYVPLYQYYSDTTLPF